MRAPQWKPVSDLIQRLLSQPQRFEFAQAVRIAHAWLRRTKPPQASGAGSHVRFRNRLSLEFPPSQVDAIEVEVEGEHTACQVEANCAATVSRISITPAWSGLLGVGGALPYHYTEALLEDGQRDVLEARRAFFDLLSQRAHALHHSAWNKASMVGLPDAGGPDVLGQVQWALAGLVEGEDSAKAEVFEHAFCAFYAGALRPFCTSSQMLQAVLAEYFDAPVAVLPFVGQWHALMPDQTFRLGGNCALKDAQVLGPRVYSIAEGVRLRIGPLPLDQFEGFLPGSPGVQALEEVLRMFRVTELSFDVQLILRTDDQAPVVLGAHTRPARRLGFACVTASRPDRVGAHAGVRYRLGAH